MSSRFEGLITALKDHIHDQQLIIANTETEIATTLKNQSANEHTHELEHEFHEAVASKIEFPSTDGLEVIKLLTQINEMNAQIDHVQK